MPDKALGWFPLGFIEDKVFEISSLHVYMLYSDQWIFCNMSSQCT